MQKLCFSAHIWVACSSPTGSSILPGDHKSLAVPLKKKYLLGKFSNFDSLERPVFTFYKFLQVFAETTTRTLQGGRPLCVFCFSRCCGGGVAAASRWNFRVGNSNVKRTRKSTKCLEMVSKGAPNLCWNYLSSVSLAQRLFEFKHIGLKAHPFYPNLIFCLLDRSCLPACTILSNNMSPKSKGPNWVNSQFKPLVGRVMLRWHRVVASDVVGSSLHGRERLAQVTRSAFQHRMSEEMLIVLTRHLGDSRSCEMVRLLVARVSPDSQCLSVWLHVTGYGKSIAGVSS